MTNSSPDNPVDLNDPAIEPLRLQELAQSHPQLWDDILQHPNVYPGLADWIRDRQAEQAADAPQEGFEESTDDAAANAPEAAEPAATEDFTATEHQAPDAEQPFEPTPPTEQTWGWAQPHSYEHTGQQPFGYQQQFGYGQQQQQQYGQPPQFMAQRSGASKIDFSTRRTWGLMIASAAAFLSLFGFFFNPSQTNTPLPALSHFSSGGWVLLLLVIATLAVSVVELLIGNRWTRYAFIVLGIGTAFALIGRYMTLGGFLTLYNTGFSLVWIMFMAFVMLAGTMVFLAPSGTTTQSPQSPQQPQQFQSAPSQPGAQYNQFDQSNQYGGRGQQPGQYPQGGYGPQPGNSPQSGQPGGSQQFGGYYPPQNPGSPY